MACELCASPGGRLLYAGDDYRVVWVDAPALPGYCRVVLTRHVVEMSDLPADQAAALQRVVLVVERAVRAVVVPDKVNLASLGNVVPHLHWHVIPRWRNDPWFPDAVWAAAQRAVEPRVVPPDSQARLRTLLAAELDAAKLDRS